jgi:hypothetical protein
MKQKNYNIVQECYHGPYSISNIHEAIYLLYLTIRTGHLICPA